MKLRRDVGFKVVAVLTQAKKGILLTLGRFPLPGVSPGQEISPMRQFSKT